MAAPSIAASGTYRQGTSSAPAFANPTGVVAGSVVVGCFYLDSSTTISALPSGFAHAPGSPVRVGAGLGGEHTINVIWKRAGASESADYTVTFSASQYSNGRFFRVEGCVASGSPWDTNSGTGAAVATDTTNSTTAPAVSMTTQNNDQLGWYMTSNWAGGAWTPPGTWSEQMDNGDETCTVDTKTLTTAGATGSVQATCAGSNKRAAWLGSLLSTAISSGTSINAGNDALAVAANNAGLAVGAPVGNDALAVAAGAAGLAVKIPAGNDAVAVAAGAAGLAVKVPTGADALAVGAFNASISVGTQLAAGGAAASVAAASSSLAVSASLGGAALSGAAFGATLKAAPSAGNAALSGAAGAAGLAVSTGAGGAALSVGAFDASLQYGTLLQAGAAAVGVGAADVVLLFDLGGLAGNAHGPLPVALGSIVVHTGSIAGAIT